MQPAIEQKAEPIIEMAPLSRFPSECEIEIKLNPTYQHFDELTAEYSDENRIERMLESINAVSNDDSELTQLRHKVDLLQQHNQDLRELNDKLYESMV